MELVTLDLDGTLIANTAFQAAADGLGIGEEIARYDRHYFQGCLSLEATFMVEHRLFQGRPKEAVQAALLEGPWLAGIEEAVAELRARGLAVWAVTDQPDWAVEVLEPWGIDPGVFSRTHRRAGEIGSIQEHAFDKWDRLARRLEADGIEAPEVCHVGNGSNDVPIFQEVGSAIAFNPDGPHVEAAADAIVKTEDLRDVLSHVPG